MKTNKQFRLNTALGYMYTIDKTHPWSCSNGILYEHKYVMCLSIGRDLNPDEVVHHIDRDRSNNSLSNLMLMTRKEHSILHSKEDSMYTDSTCKSCGKVFKHLLSDVRTYCSVYCCSKGREKLSITKEELEYLVWSKPTSQLAKDLGISDVAIAKKCKTMGISKPPRGYWRKLETNTLS